MSNDVRLEEERAEEDFADCLGAITECQHLKRVIVTPAVYPRLVEFLHFDIQSTGQKSHCVSSREAHHNALF